MRWFNHIVLAAAPVALIAPRLVPVAILGATAPDWLEWLAKIARQPLPHRGPTLGHVWIRAIAIRSRWRRCR
jgi:inner membrane protein